jgi:hypothetical protein
MSGGSDSPADTMRGRVAGNRLWLWLLLEADRRAVAAAMAGVVFASLVALGALDPSPLRETMRRTDPVETLFQALVTGIVTGVTLVLTINQLVLSQELGPAGDQRDRMRGALDFRESVADAVGSPTSPAQPSAFLRALVEEAARHADALDAAVEPGGDWSDEVSRLVADVRENARAVSRRLDGAEFGTFAVVSAALDFNYSWKLHETRRLAGERGDALGDEERAAFDGLERALELFGPAREHVKTLYFQWALVDLSRDILYAAVPALVATVGGLLYLDAGAMSGATLGVDDVVWTVSGVVTVALVPFVLLLAYILRIATVAKHTLSIGPFILRETDRAGEADREGG